MSCHFPYISGQCATLSYLASRIGVGMTGFLSIVCVGDILLLGRPTLPSGSLTFKHNGSKTWVLNRRSERHFLLGICNCPQYRR